MFSLPPWQPLAAALVLSGLSLATQAAPLSFQAALDAAERNAPQLAAQRAGIDAARAAAISAGALPDPKLSIGIDNLPVSGTDRWRLKRDFMTMQKIGLMQEVPNAGKRQARVDAADAALARSEIERTLTTLTVRREAALAWLKRYYLERKQALFDDLAHENRLLADVVRAQLASGRGTAADVLSPRQEAAMLAERRDELSRDLALAHSALVRWVGAEASQALQGEAPSYPVGPDRLQGRLQQHPELAVYVATTALAEAQLKEAEAGKRPDWGVEIAYQRRAAQFGDMVSVQFSFDLPIFQSTRQTPQIAARQAELRRVAAEREALLREHRQLLAADLAEYGRLDQAISRQQHDFLPLAQQKVLLQTASYRSGKVDLTAVLAARRELIDVRLKTIDLDSQRAQLATRLHFTYGENE
ncbi:TolC family protein [Chitinimonas arctica]|uniref:TolC family protein n=1 Tax=Chitinimonas arctica TaxID=2594795 RepID=A0A516SBP8_9NEIS|nr:TolC family protein [Chitinimonas arctica]QDQ25488.1 TolC family protein [Chitinimonas arctica]